MSSVAQRGEPGAASPGRAAIGPAPIFDTAILD
jgi:hypothetical protein